MKLMSFHFGIFAAITLTAMLASSQASAVEELSIVDVRRHITLADDDIVYKDFYLNGGAGEGLKKNLVVTAVRKIQVRDASGSQGYGEITVPVGQLRIIDIQGKIAVAREYKLLSRDELPMLEQTGLMSGDRIDLKGAFIDNAKPKYVKPTVAEATSTQRQIRVADARAARSKQRTPNKNTAVASKANTNSNRAPASLPESALAAKASPATPNAPNTTSEAFAAENKASAKASGEGIDEAFLETK